MLEPMQLWQIKRKIHVSWIVAITCAGIVVGTALSSSTPQTLFSGGEWLAAGLSILAIVMWRRTLYLVPLVLVAGMLIGLWRGSVVQADINVFEAYVGTETALKGRIIDDPDTGEKGEMKLRIGDVFIGGEKRDGKVWASTDSVNELKRGDDVTLKGTLSPGFGSFAAAMFSAEIIEATRPQPGDVAREARDMFADKVRIGIDEPQSSLGLGFLLGQRRSLPEDLEKALVVTGLTHIVVASGYNLTILVRIARRMFAKISKYLATISSATMILLFIAVTGASPSMTRAGLVAWLSLAAWYYGRKFHPLVLLPFAAAVTVLVDPTFAWNDIGWQLSFTAFAGVMILAPLLQRYFFGDKEPGTVRQILGETTSAFIVTLPILAYSFGQFSNVAIVTNLLVLPFVPLAMLLVFVTGLVALAHPAVAPVIGAPADWLLSYMIAVIRYFAEFSWAQANADVQSWAVWLAYAVICAICVYLWRATHYDLRNSNIIE